jgi:hypothetical protein
MDVWTACGYCLHSRYALVRTTVRTNCNTTVCLLLAGSDAGRLRLTRISRGPGSVRRPNAPQSIWARYSNNYFATLKETMSKPPLHSGEGPTDIATSHDDQWAKCMHLSKEGFPIAMAVFKPALFQARGGRTPDRTVLYEPGTERSTRSYVDITWHDQAHFTVRTHQCFANVSNIEQYLFL